MRVVAAEDRDPIVARALPTPPETVIGFTFTPISAPTIATGSTGLIG
jgi:hypothetical protein